MTTTSESNAQALVDRIATYDRVVVAFSGGVDSSVVAAAAHAAKLTDCIAVTAHSPSVATWQLKLAKKIAGEIGIGHQVVKTTEGDLPEYQRNDRRRCFFCKQTLYQSLGVIAQAHDKATILSGTNADDLGDYRPGIEAGNLANVKTPLAELGLGKSDVRAIAQYFGLSNDALPASPCLASRIAYGIEVTPERLKRVEVAEDWLRQRGFSDCRVRVHEGELARVEVPLGELSRLTQEKLSGELTAELLRVGFRFVTVDLQGLRSGNLNSLVVLSDTDLA